MEAKIRIRICNVIVTGLVLVLTYSCQKDLDDTIIIIDNDNDTSYYTSCVTIGAQVWMTKNLKTRRYRNGDKIQTTIPPNLEITEEVAPKYQWAYNADEISVDTYGRLYTWYTITDPRGVCPKGWHVPTDEDWTILTNFVNEKLYAGGNLKEAGTMHWAAPNTGATNLTEFTALPGGYRFYYGRFSDIGFSGFWWSSSEASDITAYGRGMLNYNNQVPRFDFDKRYGLSVRCILDK